MRDVLISGERWLSDGSRFPIYDQIDPSVMPFIVPENAMMTVRGEWCTYQLPAKDLTPGILLCGYDGDVICVMEVSLSPEDDVTLTA